MNYLYSEFSFHSDEELQALASQLKAALTSWTVGAEYSIGGRSYKFQSLAELRRMLTMVAEEVNARAGVSPRRGIRQVPLRFR